MTRFDDGPRREGSYRRRGSRGGALACLALSAQLGLWSRAHAQTPHASEVVMRRVAGGRFEPFFRTPTQPGVDVQAFWLDEHAVTNGEYLTFVQAHRQWARSRVSRALADDEYLSHWAGDETLGAQALAQQPVTRVSWFAASAYCRARSARLPTEAEWEIAARDPSATPRILAWYARPQQTLGLVRSTQRNDLGLWDLHGLIWEWVQDFNALRAVSDGRRSENDDGARFCGGAATLARDPNDYASFMRFGFRSSLRGTYTVRNLGFRCARDDGALTLPRAATR